MEISGPFVRLSSGPLGLPSVGLRGLGFCRVSGPAVMVGTVRPKASMSHGVGGAGHVMTGNVI